MFAFTDLHSRVPLSVFLFHIFPLSSGSMMYSEWERTVFILLPLINGCAEMTWKTKCYEKNYSPLQGGFSWLIKDSCKAMWQLWRISCRQSVMLFKAPLCFGFSYNWGPSKERQLRPPTNRTELKMIDVSQEKKNPSHNFTFSPQRSFLLRPILKLNSANEEQAVF